MDAQKSDVCRAHTKFKVICMPVSHEEAAMGAFQNSKCPAPVAFCALSRGEGAKVMPKFKA